VSRAAPATGTTTSVPLGGCRHSAVTVTSSKLSIPTSRQGAGGDSITSDPGLAPTTRVSSVAHSEQCSTNTRAGDGA
jgi:hypothetical protein